jgi:hypothetical protein
MLKFIICICISLGAVGRNPHLTVTYNTSSSAVQLREIIPYVISILVVPNQELSCSQVDDA